MKKEDIGDGEAQLIKENEKYYKVENGRMDIINPFDVRFGLD